MKILSFVGSLRKGSLNKKLLKNAIKVAPEGMEIEVFDLKDIPLYNMDVEQESGFPESVEVLREKIREADGVLIVSPEHNYSMPGVLKNAIDWISRGPKQPMKHKPVGLIGASDGRFGAVRALLALRVTLQALEGIDMPKPEMHLANADQKFDENDNLTDEKDLENLKKFMQAFSEWVKKLS